MISLCVKDDLLGKMSGLADDEFHTILYRSMLDHDHKDCRISPTTHTLALASLL
jgi:hypothetical protein